MDFLLHADGLEMDGIKRKRTFGNKMKGDSGVFEEPFCILLNFIDVFWDFLTF